MIIGNRESYPPADPLQKELVRCLGDPGPVLCEDIFGTFLGVCSNYCENPSTIVGQWKVSATVRVPALILSVGDFVEALTFSAICPKKLLAVNMNVPGTDIRPLEGTELARPHSGLDSQQNCISAWIWNSAFEFFFYAQNLIPCEDLLAGIENSFLNILYLCKDSPMMRKTYGKKGLKRKVRLFWHQRVPNCRFSFGTS